MNKKYKRQTKAQAEEIVKIIIDEYKGQEVGLHFETPFQLAVALILAAQCTDERVNATTPILFKKYPTIESLKNAKLEDIKKIVKPCGFYNNKAISIKETARITIDEFGGTLPCDIDKLQKLRGIGRKSANIIMLEGFGKCEGIAVDTHVTRISRKIGLSNGKNPIEIEKDLLKLLDEKYWVDLNHVLVLHGRQKCIANRPQCDECPINNMCKKND